MPPLFEGQGFDTAKPTAENLPAAGLLLAPHAATCIHFSLVDAKKAFSSRVALLL
jgi:hypothetical protein